MRSLPIGTIREDTRGRTRYRRIKVKNEGTHRQRWPTFARWWWEQNRGPVPAGHFVAHANSNTMDDHPSNFVLRTHEQRLSLWRSKTCGKPRYAHRRGRPRKYLINKPRKLDERKLVNRATRWLEHHWYPVDTRACTIRSMPCKTKLDLFKAMGRNKPKNNGAWGWPELPTTDASILAASDALVVPCTIDNIADKALQLIARAGIVRPAQSRRRGAVRAAMRLSKAGLLDRTMVGRFAHYAITQFAMCEQKATDTIVPVLGADLHADKYKGFTKIDESGKIIDRFLNPDEMTDGRYCASCTSVLSVRKGRMCFRCSKRKSRHGACACGFAYHSEDTSCRRCGVLRAGLEPALSAF